jgi:hypothetical protein
MTTCRAFDPWMRLDPHTQVIGVIELAPARFDDAIIIKLHKKILKDRPLYDALSYVWGDETSADAAIVNDLQVTIGFSLDSALRHLRQDLDGGVRFLWVGVLFIDQNSLEERNEQVQLMKDVYSCAKIIYIWLGPAQPDDNVALSCIERGRDKLPKDTEGLECCVKVLGRIFHRPWFERLWVVQEFVLAKEGPILCLGYNKMPWRGFYKHVSWLHLRAEDENLFWSSEES